METRKKYEYLDDENYPAMAEPREGASTSGELRLKQGKARDPPAPTPPAPPLHDRTSARNMNAFASTRSVMSTASGLREGSGLAAAEDILDRARFSASFSERVRFWIVHHAVERPCFQCCAFFFFAVCVVVLLGAHVAITGIDLITDDAGLVAWYPVSSTIARQADAYTQAVDMVRASDLAASPGVDHSFATASTQHSLTLLLWQKQGGGAVLSRELLQFVCELEKTVVTDEDYEKLCWRGTGEMRAVHAAHNASSAPDESLAGFYRNSHCALHSTSLANFFYGDRNDYSCPLLPEAYFNARRDLLFSVGLLPLVGASAAASSLAQLAPLTAADNNTIFSQMPLSAQQGVYRFFLDEIVTDPATQPTNLLQATTTKADQMVATRSLIQLGAPAPGYNNERDRFPDQQKEFYRDLWVRVYDRLISKLKRAKAPFQGTLTAQKMHC
eukprot:g9138.t1